MTARARGVDAADDPLMNLEQIAAYASVGAGEVRRDMKRTPGYDVTAREAISEYGALYLHRRAATLTRTHAVACARCGPAGHPAQPGSPWSAAHQQADALRIVSKRVLRDLWIAARDYHEGTQP